MADKHHSGRFVKAKQREIEKEMPKVFGMRDDGSLDFNKAVLMDIDKGPALAKEVMRQNDRIETQEAALDDGSRAIKDYTAMKETNEKFVEAVESFERKL